MKRLPQPSNAMPVGNFSCAAVAGMPYVALGALPPVTPATREITPVVTFTMRTTKALLSTMYTLPAPSTARAPGWLMEAASAGPPSPRPAEALPQIPAKRLMTPSGPMRRTT